MKHRPEDPCEAEVYVQLLAMAAEEDARELLEAQRSQAEPPRADTATPASASPAAPVPHRHRIGSGTFGGAPQGSVPFGGRR